MSLDESKDEDLIDQISGQQLISFNIPSLKNQVLWGLSEIYTMSKFADFENTGYWHKPFQFTSITVTHVQADLKQKLRCKFNEDFNIQSMDIKSIDYTHIDQKKNYAIMQEFKHDDENNMEHQILSKSYEGLINIIANRNILTLDHIVSFFKYSFKHYSNEATIYFKSSNSEQCFKDTENRSDQIYNKMQMHLVEIFESKGATKGWKYYVNPQWIAIFGKPVFFANITLEKDDINILQQLFPGLPDNDFRKISIKSNNNYGAHFNIKQIINFLIRNNLKMQCGVASAGESIFMNKNSIFMTVTLTDDPTLIEYVGYSSPVEPLKDLSGNTWWFLENPVCYIF